MVLLKTAHIARPATSSSPLTGFATVGSELLAEEDPHLHGVLCAEHTRQETQLSLLPTATVTDPSVLSCMASAANNATAHDRLDDEHRAIEDLAVARAKSAFGARYANVRPHSAVEARAAVLAALTGPRDVVLDVRADHDPVPGRAGQDTVRTAHPGGIDYAEVAALARAHRPRVITVGGPHQRPVDYAGLRTIADDVGALLVADISHVAGLVLTGLRHSPIDHAHVTTTCTHTNLAGPQGALVLAGREADQPAPGPDRRTLAARLHEQLSAARQGPPALPVIAGKARALDLAQSDTFRDTVRQMVVCAEDFADELAHLGNEVSAGGSHLVVLDLADRGVGALIAEQALEEVGIVVDAVVDAVTDTVVDAAAGTAGGPGAGAAADATGAAGGALRIGTASVAQRGFGRSEARQTAQLVDAVLGAVRPRGARGYQVEEFTRLSARDAVRRLLSQFPLPRYVPVNRWGGVR